MPYSRGKDGFLAEALAPTIDTKGSRRCFLGIGRMGIAREDIVGRDMQEEGIPPLS